MILGIAVAIIALSVPLCGGSLARLADVRFRRAGLIAASLAIQVLIISVIPGDIPELLAAALHVVSYVLATGFVWANRRIPWLWLVAVGGLSNLIAIGANGGVMPASPRALAAAGRALRSAQFRNSTDVANAHLRFLGDVFAVPRGWPLANVFSIGDVVLMLGSALLLHAVCQTRTSHLRLPSVRAMMVRHATDSPSSLADP